MTIASTFRLTIVGSFSIRAAGNPTLAIIKAAFHHEGLPRIYENCEVQPAGRDAAVNGATAMGWRGFNCSMPHKQTVIPLLSELSQTAAPTNAVNCVTPAATRPRSRHSPTSWRPAPRLRRQFSDGAKSPCPRTCGCW